MDRKEKQEFHLYAIPRDENYILTMEKLDEFIQNKSINTFNELNNIKKNNVDEEPAVFAIPCDRPFVVAGDKAKEFMEIKPNPEILRRRKELLKKLNIKVEIEPINFKGPVLKKIIK